MGSWFCSVPWPHFGFELDPATGHSGTRERELKFSANNSARIPVNQFRGGSCENESVEQSSLYEKAAGTEWLLTSYVSQRPVAGKDY